MKTSVARARHPVWHSGWGNAENSSNTRGKINLVKITAQVEMSQCGVFFKPHIGPAPNPWHDLPLQGEIKRGFPYHIGRHDFVFFVINGPTSLCQFLIQPTRHYSDQFRLVTIEKMIGAVKFDLGIVETVIKLCARTGTPYHSFKILFTEKIKHR